MTVSLTTQPSPALRPLPLKLLTHHHLYTTDDGTRPLHALLRRPPPSRTRTRPTRSPPCPTPIRIRHPTPAPRASKKGTTCTPTPPQARAPVARTYGNTYRGAGTSKRKHALGLVALAALAKRVVGRDKVYELIWVGHSSWSMVRTSLHFHLFSLSPIFLPVTYHSLRSPFRSRFSFNSIHSSLSVSPLCIPASSRLRGLCAAACCVICVA
jgi:hypothetical protein